MQAGAQRHPLWLLTGFWICVVISLAVVVRRLIALASPASTGNSPVETINATFSSHALLTVAHIVPAALFVILAVWVLLTAKSGEWRMRLFFLTGAVTGVTAYAMSGYAIGGWAERSAVLVFDSWFLWSLGRAYLFHRRHDCAKERDWTTRAVTVLLGIATTRPVMGVFFASSRVTHLTPSQFFGIAFWIGFSVNVLVVELWLGSRTRSRERHRRGVR